MAEYKYKMPDVGEGVVEAEIVEWHVKPGDKVVEDQHILDVMTDKATVEIPCAVNGVVKTTVGEPGEIIAVGTVILVIEIDGTPPTEETEAEPAKDGAKAESSPPPPAGEVDGAKRQTEGGNALAEKPAEPKPSTPAPSAASASTSPAGGGGQSAATSRPSGERPLASPAVRQRALEADIDLAAVPGTGPAGRITHEDLDDFIASGGRLASKAGGSGTLRAPRTGLETIKVIGLRRKIAENMALAKRTIPHIAYVEEIDLTALEELRAHLNASRTEGREKLTLIPFLVAALVRALPGVPQANAHYDTENAVLTQYEGVHCGIAAATPKGLMVPVIRHAEALDVWQIAAEVKRLAEAARTGKATKEELTGSTITITSLGAMGGIVTTPVINHPETAIIGVNKLQTLPRYDAEGRVSPRKIMNLSSSFDHRIVDGYDAARLIQAVKGYLEHPATLFME
ncbi:2-oxo acid dehydrogenase subunit E2 [Alkalicaulis satelles]|uniref:Dihydrolipoamide acetyltransferase component of pyruvate dehydrogenase complex n=1 Tax=Alkalicaulis satelles TaxID=2609175 RepID=A0A5M6ZD72_9PROT|nr:dihydrolipoamide acetyltransferase family protein [Alkalicaulis satelles]KAA5801018.1 2-oxo acid dehydrogenase subunit E2 [Alkalicaulis satelles]